MSPIALRAKKCVGFFEDLVELLRQPGHQHDHDLSEVEVTDAFGRFKIWAGNIGAFQKIELKSSLDFRLRETPKISTQIVEILDELAESLEDACSIVSDAKENRKGSSLARTGEAQDSSHGEEEQSEDSDELSEIREIFESIQDAINHLFRYSIIIRNNTNRDRYAKAAASAISSPFNDEFDVQHVRHKFPLLESKNHGWLVERLGKAITQRRQYLRYCRSHHDKTWQAPATKASLDIIRPVEQKLQTPAKLIIPSSRSDFSKPTSTLAPTQASTLLLTAGQIIDEEAAEETQSQTSYATSTDEEINNHALHVIPLEDVSKGLRHFECPYCWQIQTCRAQKAWKKHVLSDLKPYVCTFEDCELKLFSDQQTWFSHELKDHRKEWNCHFCAHSPFNQSAAYNDHLITHHPQAFSEDQLPALFEMSEKPLLKMSPTDCPFCDDWEERLRAVNPHIPVDESLVVTPSQFQHHVGAHMIQLALFAIPRGYTEEGEADSANAAPQIDSEGSSLNESGPDSTTAKQLRQCEDILEEVVNLVRHVTPYSSEKLFQFPKFPIQLEPFGRFWVTPINLTVISQNLQSGTYTNFEDFLRDLILYFAQYRVLTDPISVGIEEIEAVEWHFSQLCKTLRKEYHALETISLAAKKIQWFVWTAKQLAPMPLDAEAQTIVIHLRNGEAVTREFLPEPDLEDLYAFVECYDLIKYAPNLPAVGRPSGYLHEYNFKLLKPDFTIPEGIFDSLTESWTYPFTELDVVDLEDGELPRWPRRSKERSAITPHEEPMRRASPLLETPQASQTSSGKKHLDASGPREVVFCYQCEHEWYQDESGLICPKCYGAITEIIDPEFDPRPTHGPAGSNLSVYLAKDQAEKLEKLQDDTKNKKLSPEDMDRIRDPPEGEARKSGKIGTLGVEVTRARNLPTDATPNAQVYCKVQLYDVVKRTTNDDDGGGAPIWVQELQFDVLDDSLEYFLYVTVLNGGEEEIGRASIILNGLSTIEEKWNEDWYQLTNRGIPTGKILLRLRFLRDKQLIPTEDLVPSITLDLSKSSESENSSPESPGMANIERSETPKETTLHHHETRTSARRFSEGAREETRPYVVPDVSPRAIPAAIPVAAAWHAGKDGAEAQSTIDRLMSRPLEPLRPIIMGRVRPAISYGSAYRPLSGESRFLDDSYIDDLKRDDLLMRRKRDVELKIGRETSREWNPELKAGTPPANLQQTSTLDRAQSSIGTPVPDTIGPSTSTVPEHTELVEPRRHQTSERQDDVGQSTQPETDSHFWKPLWIALTQSRISEDQNKYYFLIEVKFNDGQYWELSRSSGEFPQLHLELLREFPNETAIQVSPPVIPKPVEYIHSSVTDEMMYGLELFLKNLLKLPSHVSESYIVRAFFIPRKGDHQMSFENKEQHGCDADAESSEVSGDDDDKDDHEWDMDTVLAWLRYNRFPTHWRKLFVSHGLNGSAFLALGNYSRDPRYPGIGDFHPLDIVLQNVPIGDDDGYTDQVDRLRHMVLDIARRGYSTTVSPMLPMEFLVMESYSRQSIYEVDLVEGELALAVESGKQGENVYLEISEFTDSLEIGWVRVQTAAGEGWAPTSHLEYPTESLLASRELDPSKTSDGLRFHDHQWTREELDILIDLTSKQMVLNMEDREAASVWTEEHWANVSQRLGEKGSVRTTADCHKQWNSFFLLPRTNEIFASAGWNDEERKIVLDMTAKEVERLVNWEASGIPALHAVHWNRVSQELKDHGYIKSAQACLAYWVLARGEAIPPFNSYAIDDEDEGDNRDPDAYVPGQHHPRRLSDVLEEDERSRQSETSDTSSIVREVLLAGAKGDYDPGNYVRAQHHPRRPSDVLEEDERNLQNETSDISSVIRGADTRYHSKADEPDPASAARSQQVAKTGLLAGAKAFQILQRPSELGRDESKLVITETSGPSSTNETTERELKPEHSKRHMLEAAVVPTNIATRYTPEELKNLQASPLIAKPPDFPHAEPWMRYGGDH